MSRIIDISRTITPSLTIWKGDPPLELKLIQKIEDGAPCNVTHLSTTVHTGTHVDAPYHFIDNGRGIETLSLEVLIGPAQVVQVPDTVDLITADVIRQCGITPGAVRVLFKTRNSTYWQKGITEFQTGFVALSPDAAEEIIRLGIRLVGIDYLSIAPYNDAIPTHVALLKAGIIPLETLDLSNVTPGHYQLVCLPLKIGGSDGAPARAVLISE